MSFPLFLSLALKSTLILAVAALAAFALRRASAATRHLVWVAALAGLLLLPVIGALGPGVGAPGSPADRGSAGSGPHGS